MPQGPKYRRPLATVLADLRYLKPYLVLVREQRTFRIEHVSEYARREEKSGSPATRRYLSAFNFWWDEDPDGKVIIMEQTPEGPWPLAAEYGSRFNDVALDNEGDWGREMVLSGSTRKRESGEYRVLREGLWRTIQRIHRGIPGIIGTGHVTESQFTGGTAGIRTAWTLRPYSTFPMIDAVPIAGFYAFGQYWPQMINLMGLPGDLSDVVRELNDEFGLASDADLERGTVPNPGAKG